MYKYVLNMNMLLLLDRHGLIDRGMVVVHKNSKWGKSRFKEFSAWKWL